MLLSVFGFEGDIFLAVTVAGVSFLVEIVEFKRVISNYAKKNVILTYEVYGKA